MAIQATYDPALKTDRDHVRFLIGDTDVSAPKLDDAELDALLVDEEHRYLAAARALEVLLARWIVLGGGVVEKEVDGLRIKRMGDETAESALERLICKYRARGAELLMPAPRAFRMI